MMEMFESWLGPTLGPLAVYTMILVVLLVILAIVWFVYKILRRPRLASGKRSMQARLAVTDAAAVDARRRLVLVRRDEVEHLIMIGGPTDIVIESDIRRMVAARPRSTAESKPVPGTPKPAVPAHPTQQPPQKSKPLPLKLTPETPPPPLPTPVAQQSSTPQPAPKPATVPPIGSTVVGAAAGAAAAGVAATVSSATEKVRGTPSSLAMPKDSQKPIENKATEPSDQKSATPTAPKNDVDALLEEIALPEK